MKEAKRENWEPATGNAVATEARLKHQLFSDPFKCAKSPRGLVKVSKGHIPSRKSKS